MPLRCKILGYTFSAVSKVAVALLALSILPTCHDTPPEPPSSPTISLAVLDASCTEAWLRVSLSDLNEPRSIALKMDGQRILTASMITTDSTFVVDSLLPHRNYTFAAERLRGSNLNEHTSPIVVATMDTTSHDFTWSMDTLGVTASALNDLAIINDTLAYAVGEIYMRDSTGQIDPSAYNLAKWDGHQWQLLRIQFYDFCGQPSTGSYPTKSILAFSPTDIWIGKSGSQVVRWNGQSQTAPMCTPVSINRIWGESPNSVYAGGDNGGLAHYNGSTWQRVESGTNLDIMDIWGATNPHTGDLEILALASTYRPDLHGCMLLKVTSNSATPLSTNGLSQDLFSSWFVPERRYYAVGAGIHQKRMLSDSAWTVFPPGVVTRFFSGEVRGQGVNDVFVVGSFGEVVHFNGFSWQKYFSDVPIPSGYLGFVEIKGNLMMATGQVNASRGIVLIGRR
jgi:hypothetical protein